MMRLRRPGAAEQDSGMECDRIEVTIGGVQTRIGTRVREGRRPALLLLHGFGATKEDYADLAHHPRFRNRMIVTYDAPGHGDSECTDFSALSIAFLRAVAERVIKHFRLSRFHLAGHSMGGLTALMLGQKSPDALLSFTNIEGNLTREDCFLSRQIHTYPHENADAFFSAFIQRVRHSPGWSHALYARGLRGKVHAGAIAPLFRSIVELSDNGALLERFVELSCPRMFVYGRENRHLSYLGALQRHGIRLAEIPCSGHFPMYSNPQALWSCIGEFLDRVEGERRHDRR
ncbi:MAG: alpha/beta fold hydrolase [Alphaproteobacteria bacterium]